MSVIKIQNITNQLVYIYYSLLKFKMHWVQSIHVILTCLNYYYHIICNLFCHMAKFGNLSFCHPFQVFSIVCWPIFSYNYLQKILLIRQAHTTISTGIHSWSLCYYKFSLDLKNICKTCFLKLIRFTQYILYTHAFLKSKTNMLF